MYEYLVKAPIHVLPKSPEMIVMEMANTESESKVPEKESKFARLIEVQER